MIANPFKASLGVSPPVLVGRDDDISDFEEALENGPGTNERISVVKGARGVGKTVLLNAFEDVARSHGWRVIAESATSGFVDRLIVTLSDMLAELKPKVRTRVSELKIGAVGVAFESASSAPLALTLRKVLTNTLEAIAEADQRVAQQPTGILITLDELHHLQREEISLFAAVVQHMVRENREIAVVMAGIPSAINPLLADKDQRSQITFIRRANRIELGKVSDSDVRLGLDQPVRDVLRSWDPLALDQATEACAGYPFMIQLVGQWSFHCAFRDAMQERTNPVHVAPVENQRAIDADQTVQTVIDADSARQGIAKAQRKLGQLVHEPALDDLSDIDRTFLIAMTPDSGPSLVSDIAKRMHVTPQYANRYRRRLLEADMIVVPARGQVDFALPYMREYLRDHVAYRGLNALAE